MEDAADLKSATLSRVWGFESLSGHRFAVRVLACAIPAKSAILTPMSMERSAIVGGAAAGGELAELLRRQGISSVTVASEGDLAAIRALSDSKQPTLALIETAYMTAAEFRNCARACADAALPTLALIPRSRVPGVDAAMPLTDFIISPPDPDELVVRARRALGAASDNDADDRHIIKAGGLEIDTSSYEVSLRGERISLRFKEYELLKMLAENPGRVFSRDALLNRIWGYEYFGGTRTVDVHIRRLRSKIHNSEHNFIETVWNVGYRFRDAP